MNSTGTKILLGAWLSTLGLGGCAFITWDYDTTDPENRIPCDSEADCPGIFDFAFEDTNSYHCALRRPPLRGVCLRVGGDIAICGNGKQEGDEVCDDGDLMNGRLDDPTFRGCNADCSDNERCGNGIAEPPREVCDDGGDENGPCSDDCLTAYICGDGVIDPGEACDDGNTSSEDFCTAECVVNECGDGFVNENGGEECDPGPGIEDDTCTPAPGGCKINKCGDNHRSLMDGEECDDGNGRNDDDCVGDCKVAKCTDGFTNLSATGLENCDDGDENPHNDCDAECTVVEWEAEVEGGYGAIGVDPDLSTMDSNIAIALTPSGDLYFSRGCAVYLIKDWNSPPKNASVFAGSVECGATGDRGQAPAARLNSIVDIEVDGLGNVYIASPDRIRRVSTGGTITTVVGGGATPSGMAATASEASFESITSVVVAENEDVYFATEGTVDMVYLWKAELSNGTLSRVAGDGTSGIGTTNASGVAANLFSFCTPIVADFDDEQVFIADACIGQMLTYGTKDFLVRSRFGAAGMPGSGTGAVGDPGVSANTSVAPTDAAVEANGDIVFVEEQHHRVRRWSAAEETISIVAGTGQMSFVQTDEPVATGSVPSPRQVAARTITGLGPVIIITDAANPRIRSIDDTTIALVAGNGTAAGSPVTFTSGPLTTAELRDPTSMLDIDGSILIATENRGELFLLDGFDPQSNVTSILGDAGASPLGATPVPIGSAPFLQSITAMAYDGAGTVYLTERFAGKVLKMNVSNADPMAWTIERLSLQADLIEPSGIAVDPMNPNRLLVVDRAAHALYEIMVDGMPTARLIHGVEGTPGVFDDYLNDPRQVAVSKSDGGIFVSDAGNHRVVRLDGCMASKCEGISTVLGTGEASSSGTGKPSTSFGVNTPHGLSFDHYNNLLVTSTRSIRLVTADSRGEVRAGPDTEALTIYGLQAELSQWPERATYCVRDVLEDTPGVFYAVDCGGLLIHIERALP